MGWRALALVALAVPLLWDLAGLDMALARRMGSSAGFVLREDWWLRHVLHDRARQFAWAIGCVLCLAVVWPIGPLRRVPFGRRLQLALAPLLATAAVSLLKSGSATSCPWDLAAFGGVARYQSHWLGWFALRRDLPRLAAGWLIVSLLAGLLLGLVQQLRGAHFMSHTLWTGWLCWTVGWATDRVFTLRLAGMAEQAP